MLINDVESIVGLSKKSIRYYEENGLIHPKRNSENGYRIYDEEDIKKLKTIKFLRELGVSIKELKQLDTHELSLHECMEDRISKIRQEEEKYVKVKSLCESIYASNDDIDSIEIEHYFQTMNVLNKEGFTMRKIEEEHNKKIRSAVLASLLFVLVMALLLGVMVFAQMQEPIPIGVWLIIASIFILPICVMPFVLKERIIEIKRGEIDEASKY